MHIIKAFRISLAAILLGWSSFASAETISDYTFDFNSQDAIGQIDEAKSTQYYQYFVYDFAPQGWGHITDGIYDPSDGTTSYPSYTFEASGGVDGSGAISVGEQSAWDSQSQSTKNRHDLLVTPLVSGNASLAVKMRSTESWYDHHITFYKVSYTDGKYVHGEELAPDNAISDETTDWQTATFTLSEPTYIGIEASYAIIDNFSASQAEIAALPGLSILGVTNNATNYDADTENNVKLDYTVQIKNSGTVKLVANQTKNYSISITKGKDGPVLATVPVEQDLEIGATADVPVSASVPFSALGSDKFTAYITENLTSHTREASDVQAVPYAPLLTLNFNGNKVNSGDNIAFGSSQKSIRHKFSITNDGGKELKINSISLPEGFVTNLVAPATIAPHAVDTFSVVLSNSSIGEHSGQLKITADDLEDFTANISGTIIDPTAWYINFEDMSRWQPNVYPKGFVVETPEGQTSPDWEIFDIESSLNLVDNKLAIQNNSAERLSKFISPLLSFNGNESFSFDAAKRETSISNPKNNSILKVYYSSDRKNWNLLYTVAADETVAHDAVFSTVGHEGQGWYSSNAFEFRNYVINNIPAGKWYIAFEAGYAQVDNIVGGHVVDIAHDLAVDFSNANANGQVNHSFAATASVSNSNVKDEAEGSYTAKLYFGDEAVATASAPALISGRNTELNFSFIPHHEGTFNAHVALEFADTTIVSDPVEVTIAPESFTALKQAGDANGVTYVPIYTYDKNSEGAAIIPEAAIGLPVGTKITSLTLRGSADKDFDINLKAYLSSTDIDAITVDDEFTLETIADTANMTKIYDGEYSIKAAGSGSASGISSPADVISINLSEPFVYNGGNILLAMTHSSSSWGNIYFQGDKTNYPENGVKHSDDYNLATAQWSTYAMPVVYFGYEGSAPVITGSVTSNGTPVANVPVVLTSDGVVYSDTTSADGQYSIAVLQDKNFQLTANVAGYEPYVVNDVKVDANKTVDITLNPATGLYLENSNIPEKGEVNSQLTASATVLNDITGDIAASDYTAKLYVNGEAVADAATVDIDSQKEASFTFAYTPHEAGTFPAYIEFAYNGNTYRTDTKDVTISEENFGGLVQVGDSTGENSGSDLAPWNNYYKKFESEIIYTADQLKINKGSVITHIAFPGHLNSTGTGVESIRIYIENTSDGAYDNTTTFVPRDTTLMTNVFNGTISYGDKDPKEVYNVISIDIPQGFVYDGQNIRISTAGEHGMDSQDNKIVWTVDNKFDNQVREHRTDYGDISGATWNSINSLPVMYLTVSSKKAVTGTVTDAKTLEPIANASVKLKSGDVEYYGTTDAEGKYVIPVAKSELTYSAVFTAEGYAADTIENVAFADADTIVVDEALQTDATLGISTIDADKAPSNGNVYTIDGRFVGRNVDLKTLRSGIYIIDKKKVVIK